jgi:deoxyribodipyrimidine photo-lyase
MHPPSIVWYRRDLRLADHPALQAAVAAGGPVVPVHIWSPQEDGDWPLGAAARWWLHHSLAALASQLAQRGARLILRRGTTADVLAELAAQCGARTVRWHRRYEPAARQQEEAVEQRLRERGVECRTFTGELLHAPEAVRTGQGQPYRVFTAYWRAARELPMMGELADAPTAIPGLARPPASLDLDELGLLPRLDWAAGLRASWQPGEAGAHARLAEFLRDGLPDYAQRDFPATPCTSRLSPHLAFGEISPQRVWQAVEHALARRPQLRPVADKFQTELGWREFAWHVLCHFPQTTSQPLQSRFARLPWRRGPADLRAWQRGLTGYPIVDAGMRELWQTGWMHNRVRMVVGSFLAKDLRLHWLDGARWFWDTLVDADLASNTLNWQWVAGCGADAAPYFRILNPTLQSERFDPAGTYIRQWVPELGRLPARWLHEPWKASPAELAAAGIELGRHYPKPLVDHAAARTAALEAFGELRG